MDHPTAQDTLEGILEWWLLEQEIKRRTAEVKEALAILVGKDLVIEKKGRDGHVRYIINQRKSQEIHSLLITRPTRNK